MSDDVKSQLIWAAVVVVIVLTIAVSTVTGCRLSNEYKIRQLDHGIIYDHHEGKWIYVEAPVQTDVTAEIISNTELP